MRLGPGLVAGTVGFGLLLLLALISPATSNGLSSLGSGLPYPFSNLYGGAFLVAGLATLLATLGSQPGQTRRIVHHARARTSTVKPRIRAFKRNNQASLSSFRAAKISGWKPLPPMFKYFGGKSRMAKTLVARIPQHRTFVEPFAGGASVTLAKPPSPREVLSDKRDDLVKFYRHVKTGQPIKIPADSKAVFDRIRHKPEASRTPGEFVRLQGSSFGGHAQSYAAGSGTTARMLNRRMENYAGRLQDVTILKQDYHQTLKRYDSPTTAFFIDAPYPVDKKGYTDYGRTIPTPQEIHDAVDRLKGKVMITYPNLPSVKKAFSGRDWTIDQLRVRNAMYASTGTAKTRTELLIRNFPKSDRWRPEGVLG